jgi:hypothetical protein
MNRVLCINTGGIGDLHGIRARMLASHLEAEVTYVDVDKSQSRRKNARVIWKLLRSHPWDLVYQEATGIAGGLNLIRAAMTWGQRRAIRSAATSATSEDRSSGQASKYMNECSTGNVQASSGGRRTSRAWR